MVGATSQRQSASSQVPVLTRLLIWLIVGLSFLPYLALPLGNSTSIPYVSLASILALTRLPRLKSSEALLHAAVLGGPFVAALMGLIFLQRDPQTNALITWPLFVLPF